MNIVRRIALALFAILLAMCVAPQQAYGQAAPPVRFISYSTSAEATLDSLALDARTHRVENAACLTRYEISHDTLTLVRFTPASYVEADSVTIWTTGPMCSPGTPSLHSHVAYHGWPIPSGLDVATQAQLGVWAMILSVTDSGWRIIVYQ